MSQGVLDYIASLVNKEVGPFLDELVHFVRENKYKDIGHGIQGTFLDVLYSTGHQSVKAWSRHLKRGHVKKNDLVFIAAFLDIVIFVFGLDETVTENKLKLIYALNDHKDEKQLSLQVIIIQDEIYLNLDKKAKSEASKTKKRNITAAPSDGKKTRSIRGTKNASKSVDSFAAKASSTVPENAGIFARAQRVANARHDTKKGYSRHAQARRAALQLSQKKAEEAAAAAAAVAAAQPVSDVPVPVGITTSVPVAAPVSTESVASSSSETVTPDEAIIEQLAAAATVSKIDLVSAPSKANPHKEHRVLGKAAVSDLSFVGASAPTKSRRFASFLHGVTH